MINRKAVEGCSTFEYCNLPISLLKMSLVAYASSEEESGDEEIVDSGLKNENSNGNGAFDLENTKNASELCRDSDGELISDVSEKQEKDRPRPSIFSFLPPPSKRESEKLEISEEEDEIIRKHVKVETAELEKKGLSSAVKRPNSSINASDHIGQKRVGKLNLPKPKIRTEGEKQRVKITIPNLPSGDSDSDDEDSKASKKQTLGKSHSGLLGCLPQPKFSSVDTKGTGSKLNERKPSKLYVPYTLNKKKNSTAKTDVKLAEKENESDSDDESSSNSFFSFGENVDKLKEGLTASIKSPIKSRNIEDLGCKIEKANSSSDSVPNQIVPAPAVKNSEETTSHNSGASSRSSSVAKPPKEKKAEEDNSIAVTGPYNSASTIVYDAGSSGLYSQSAEASSRPVTESYTPYNDTYSASYNENHGGVYNGVTSATYSDAPHQDAYGSYWGSGSYYQGHMAAQHGQYGQRSYLNPEPDNQHKYLPTPTQYMEPQESIDADQLRRLQGKRERRLQEIDIIEIHGEQMQCDASTLLKNITEEKTYMPKRSKSELPSSQQKRKHQITYLAFQAKERENELRKSWAANLQTKRQTQQKYGF